MTTVTLEAVRAKQAELEQMIATLTRSAAAPAPYCVPETEIVLAPGERYAGIVLDADGRISHHLVLLPGQADDVDWNSAREWASAAGGELPTRQEQALLYANLKGEFEGVWYWSSETHAEDGSYAWYQSFGSGTRGYSRKSCGGRARAVRLIEVTP